MSAQSVMADGRRRQKGNPIREQEVWEDSFFRLPPGATAWPLALPTPGCRARPSEGLGGWHSRTLPPALSVGSVAVQVPIGCPPNKGWFSPLSLEVTPRPRTPGEHPPGCQFRVSPETIEMCFPESLCHS